MIDPARLPTAKQGDLTFWLGLAGALRESAARGLFDELCARPGKPRAQVAQAIGVDAGALGRLVDVLIAVGVVVEDAKGGLDMAAPARRAVASMPPRSIAQLWERLGGHLADGKPLGLLGDSGAERDEGYSTAVGHLSNMFRHGAAALAEALDAAPSARADERYLELGAGSGVWSLAMLARAPQARLVAVDGKLVLRRLASFAQARGLADRVEMRAGDFHQVLLEEGCYDRIVLANVLHLEPIERARSLVARAARALKPSGRLVIVDVFDRVDGGAPALRAVYALHLAMRVEGGHPHTEPVVRSFLDAAGLHAQPLLPLEPAPLGALVASRVAGATGATGAVHS